MVGEGVLLECLNRVRRLLLLSGYIIRRHEQQILEVKDIVQLAKV
jgi:hypothetical protein